MITVAKIQSQANAAGVLLDGQLVQATLIDLAEGKSLMIPVQALQKDQAGYFVLVVDTGGQVEKRLLLLGRVAGAMAVIADGLGLGEQVISQGAQLPLIAVIENVEKVMKERPELSVGAQQARR